LLELDMTNALRPSELFALHWKFFDQADQVASKVRRWSKSS
jgi:hypothetical protein